MFVLKLKRCKSAADIEQMSMPGLFKTARVLDQRKPFKVECEIENIFQSPSEFQLIAHQRGKELIALSRAHAVHMLAEIIQRVKGNLAVPRHEQLCHKIYAHNWLI